MGVGRSSRPPPPPLEDGEGGEGARFGAPPVLWTLVAGMAGAGFLGWERGEIELSSFFLFLFLFLC